MIKSIINLILIFFNYFRIPKGTYCYKMKKIIYLESGMPKIHVKYCPFYIVKTGSGYCVLLDGEIDDDCKSCRLRWSVK